MTSFTKIAVVLAALQSVILIFPTSTLAQDDSLAGSFLSGLLDTITSTADSKDCPGVCVHTLATLICYEVLEDIPCPSPSMKCCIESAPSSKNVTQPHPAQKKPNLAVLAATTTSSTTTTKPTKTTKASAPTSSTTKKPTTITTTKARPTTTTTTKTKTTQKKPTVAAPTKPATKKPLQSTTTAVPKKSEKQKQADDDKSKDFFGFFNKMPVN